MPGEAVLQPEAVTATSSSAAAAATFADLLEGLVVSTSTAITNDDSGGSLQQQELNTSSPGRSPHAAKAGWTVSGFSFIKTK